MLQKWQKREISNFDYLMYLNTLAGRSYNDYMQRPLGPVPLLYSLFISNYSGILPGPNGAIHPDLLFSAGCMQDGTVLGDVQLPPWADGDPHKFILLHRQALESDYVSAHLHHWIDLIFGHKQHGSAAVEAVNTYHPYFYGDKMDLNSIKDPLIKSTILGFISNFGQIPKQNMTTFECMADWGKCLCAVCPSATTVITSGTSSVVCVWELSLVKDKVKSLNLRQRLLIVFLMMRGNKCGKHLVLCRELNPSLALTGKPSKTSPAVTALAVSREKITLRNMKELKKLEAYGWGLNLKEVVGLTPQSSLIEIREWTPKL
ncbi:wd repeat- and fyve hypothetical protein [Limosa lapponica baueri]|uniref:BEACH domain-containing protein n=1 Tax=Limosa lapponica baueri TaxID=1758121 RepID=A0A2I0TG33_LIMLA|nr:wd repeat- and fyve hypothetical protein [Limosa lapponica baueri]